jgi:hypothetical protein
VVTGVDDNELLTEVAQTTGKTIARFKVRKAEPPLPGRLVSTDTRESGVRS